MRSTSVNEDHCGPISVHHGGWCPGAVAKEPLRKSENIVARRWAVDDDDNGGRTSGGRTLKQEARTLQGGRGWESRPEDETMCGKQLAWTATAAVASGAMRGEGHHSAIGYEDPSLVGETASKPVSGKSRRAQEAPSGP
ncbi:hypothetical protein CMUS01_06706 [Colletotrichum musicola]|uniref:Uncharacterized protein n=1 Tax=Colletotrichum musicola TaxID=2175873 RepID=A0A8H6NHP6_9PEZI|nr:hypothetical protein CMUS01_06706 [Colletotrichum musicola]